MVDTFYLHIEFTGKNGCSINLPFLCTKCGTCCTIDDFLTAGKIKSLQEYPKVKAKMNALSDELGKMWEEDEAKYDYYTTHHQCPFLVNNSCSIYEIRPEGCRLFPNTAFGMQTQDCKGLNSFKKMRATLKRGRRSKETCRFFEKASTSGRSDSVKPARFTEKQYQTCISRLCQAGISSDELSLFNFFNGRN